MSWILRSCTIFAPLNRLIGHYRELLCSDHDLIIPKKVATSHLRPAAPFCYNRKYSVYKLTYILKASRIKVLKDKGKTSMSAISVTPEELKQQAQVYIQSKEQIEQAIQRVNSMNSTIAEEWKGQAFQAYLEQYNQLEQNVRKFEELLESINQQLNKYADTVAERDAQDAQSFGF